MIKFRQIHEDDVDNVISLLERGFPEHTHEYWLAALDRLRQHATPNDYPKYGYVIGNDTALVGVLLTIFTKVGDRVRCNVSSWYVEPPYRAYGALLSQWATKNPEVTFFNVTPAPHTWSVVQSHGFKPFATGSTLALPWLNRARYKMIHVTSVADIPADAALPQSEITLLLDHAKFGCICLLGVVNADGVKERTYYPFVFLPRTHGFVPIASLIYSHNIYQFVRLAGSIGRFLLRRGLPLVKFNSDGPTRGIIGYHVDNRPKFRKGNDELIGAADIAYCEQVMFGR